MGKHKKKSGGAFGNRTSLDRHKHVGKSLIPPLAQLPKSKPSSWINERLPDYLWAVVLLGSAERDPVLELFRQIADDVFRHKDVGGIDDLSLTGLSAMPDEHAMRLLRQIAGDPGHRDLLSALLFFPTLPGRARWEQVLAPGAAMHAEIILQRGVARSINHQSQEATDCRWLIVLTKMVAGLVQMPREIGEPILRYPLVGDLRMVRPSIRSMEIGMSSMNAENTARKDWCTQFWEYARIASSCRPLLEPKVAESQAASPATADFETIWLALADHFRATNRTTAVDAKHDAAFGFAFFALALGRELLGLGGSVLNRLGLRTLFEIYATFEYLRRRNDDESWQAYRVHGMGQAKLASLKVDQHGAAPFLDTDTLNMIANEDVWEEFLTVNLGHWDASNLRSMCTDPDLKSEYDRYYGWTSNYTHGQWGAVRETIFEPCGNPLHRLHRIPRPAAAISPEVMKDAVRLINFVLTTLATLYPNFQSRLPAQQ